MKILITGASQGIGRGLALEYARHGNELVLAARNLQALGEIAGKIEASGGKAYIVQCDVSIREQVKDAVAFAIDKIGVPDLAILNAGVSIPFSFNDIHTEELEHTFATNVFSIIYAMEFLLPEMKKIGKGRIAAVSSIADIRGFHGSGAYAASKAALSRLMEAARSDLAGSGIDVITIRPGFVRTNMTAKNKFYMPFLMDSDRAILIITKQLETRKKVISFPYTTLSLAWMTRALPDKIFEFFIKRANKLIFK